MGIEGPYDSYQPMIEPDPFSLPNTSGLSIAFGIVFTIIAIIFLAILIVLLCKAFSKEKDETPAPEPSQSSEPAVDLAPSDTPHKGDTTPDQGDTWATAVNEHKGVAVGFIAALVAVLGAAAYGLRKALKHSAE